MREKSGENTPVNPARLLPPQQHRHSRPDPLIRQLRKDYERNFPPSSAEKLRRRGKAILAGAIISTDLLYGGLTIDGLIQEQELLHTEPSIIDVTDEQISPDRPDTATVFALGFGGLTAEDVASGLSAEFSQQGEVWALHYDNKGINIHKLVEVIIAKAKEEGVTKLSFYGISIGGVIELAIAEEIITGDYGITDIPAFTFDSTPINEDVLKSSYAEEGALQRDLHEIFGIRARGKIARWAVEMYLNRDRYWIEDRQFNKEMDFLTAFIKTSNMVIKNTILSPEAASNQLLNSAYLEFSSLNAEDLINSIGEFQEDNNRPKTTWTYIGGPGDYIVDTKESSEQFGEIISEAGFADMQVALVPGIIHGLPLRTPEIYQETLDTVIPNMNQAIVYQNSLVADSQIIDSVADSARQ